MLVRHAVEIGHALGISDRVIGLTAVALGTSLPELATAVTAAAKKQMDLVVGNVVGSNIFNILLIIGAVASISPISFDVDLMAIDGPFMLVMTVLMTVMLLTGKKLTRIEGGILLASAVLYTGYLYTFI